MPKSMFILLHLLPSVFAFSIVNYSLLETIKVADITGQEIDLPKAIFKNDKVEKTADFMRSGIPILIGTKHRITSKILGYDLQYWVHLPADYNANEKYPTLYVTDGLWYKESGELSEIADKLIKRNKIQSLIIIFVDAYDPDNSEINRRNAQFFCNEDYVEFYRQELIPEIDSKYSTVTDQSSRGILGLSFGGLNAMYFGTHGHDIFGKVGIQSPAPHPCPKSYEYFNNLPKLPIDIFLSTGTVNDKAKATRKLKVILEEKGYDFEYKEVAEGHNWQNWKPLLDDVLLRFYGI